MELLMPLRMIMQPQDAPNVETIALAPNDR
jgi:hypothetical protein